jgi:DNA polymerase-1
VEVSVPDVPLLLVNGHALLWRAVFGFPARITSRDKARDVTGVFGFFALLRAAVRDELPAAPEVVAVFDGEDGVAQRRQADGAYEAHRPVDAAALAPVRSLPDVRRGLDVVGLPWAEIDDAEADDVIAALVRSAGADRDVWIMSGDRDFYQLVTDRVRVVNTAMRPGQRVTGPKEIEARYGVLPHRWCDRVALVGDPADGLPGVRGIGTVTAARLLAGGLALEDLPGSGRLTGRAGRLISGSFDQVLLWRDLVRMRADVAVPQELSGCPAPPLPPAADVVAALGVIAGRWGCPGWRRCSGCWSGRRGRTCSRG